MSNTDRDGNKNCSNMVNCKDCNNSSNCTDCTRVNYSSNMVNCTDCANCSNCTDCSGIKNVSNGHGIHEDGILQGGNVGSQEELK